MDCDEAFAKNVEEARYLIGCHICPVCKRSTASSKDPHRTLKQHIRRDIDGHHKLWRMLFWKAVFRRAGERFKPKVNCISDVEDCIIKFYGRPVMERLKEPAPQILA